MTEPASTPIVIVISTLPVILGCALLGATAARAATCTADPSACQPYVATIQVVGPNVVATGSGEFDLTGLTPPPLSAIPILLGAAVTPQLAFLSLGSGTVLFYGSRGQISGPTNFGPGSGGVATSFSGPAVARSFLNDLNGSYPTVSVSSHYASGMFLGPSQNIWDNATFASLGISDSNGNVAPNIYRWTWGGAADQSFTLDIVPLPAALPLFATGIGGLGLLGWRRKRKACVSLLGAA